MPLVGLSSLYYAKLTQDTSAGVTYDTPAPIAGAITAKVSPKVTSDVLYADDGAAETASALGEIEVELQVKDLPLDIHAALLGHTLGEDGVLYQKNSDTPPYVAIGFKSLKSNGNYRYVWLLKGRFQPVEENYQTKEDKTTFQTPTIKGTFVMREKDGYWKITGDEDATGWAAATGSGWFSSVPTIPAGTGS